MKNVNELLNRFLVMQNCWNKKLPTISNTKEICACIKKELLSGKRNKDNLSPYVILLVASLKKINAEKLKEIDLCEVNNIPEEITIKTSYEDMYLLLLAVEGYLN